MVVKFLEKLRHRNGKNNETAPDPYDLAKAVVRHLSGGEYLTWTDLFNNIQIWGGIGSGKTTSSAAEILQSMMLNDGAGGLILTNKKTECARIERYAQNTNRQDSLQIIRPGGLYRFNFLEWIRYRYETPAAIPMIVETLFAAGELTERGALSYSGGDKFWPDAGKLMASEAFTLLIYANQPLTLENFRRLIQSAPQGFTKQRVLKWPPDSYCYGCIREAFTAAKNCPDSQWHAIQQAEQYFTTDFAAMPEKTRTSVIGTVNATIHKLTGALLRDLCVADTSNICPELCFEGVIQVLDVNLETYGEAGGALVQAIYKRIFQAAVSARDHSKPIRPVFCYIDEAHAFLTSSDWAFIATSSRENRCANIWISQHPSNYEAILQDGGRSRAAIESLLGNFNHIFHASASTKSNIFASEMIGRDYRYLPSFSHNEQSQQHALDVLLPRGPSSANEGMSLAPTNDWIFPPQNFSKFRTGGAKHGFVADALIFLNGRVFESTGQNFLISEFSQYV